MRAILLDSSDAVLLIRFEVRRGSKLVGFWATPGGSVEDGETDAEAIRRELNEELHIEVPLRGPVHTTVAQFEHEGRMVDNTDIFYVGRCTRGVARLDAVNDTERTAMQDVRWWSADEIEATTDTVFPSDLAPLIRALV